MRAACSSGCVTAASGRVTVVEGVLYTTACVQANSSPISCDARFECSVSLPPCIIQAGNADTSTAEGAHNAALLRAQQELLVERGGASCVIAGCTEIPLVLPDGPTLLNPSQVLADVIVWRTIRDRT